MKKIIYLILNLVVCSSYFGQSISDFIDAKLYSLCENAKQVIWIEDGICNTDPWTLVFEDNFEGSKLDESKWSIQLWGQGALVGDKFQEYNTLENCEVSNGTLKIWAKCDTIDTLAVFWEKPETIMRDGFPNRRQYNFTSSNIWTKYQYKYGKYEIRCKIPKGKGFWPAFWVFGGNEWNEIDVFEFWENNSFDHNMTVHYNGQSCLTDYSGPDFSQDFHTFTMYWTPYLILWYVDGEPKRITPKFYSLLGQPLDCNSINAYGHYMMNEIFPTDPMNIIANLAISSAEWQPDNCNDFPQSLEIDYIRYYKQIPCAGEIVVNDANTLNLNSGEYNIIVGTTVYIDANLVLLPGQQLEIVARDSVVIDSAFFAPVGTNLIIHNNTGLCQSSWLPTQDVVSEKQTDSFFPAKVFENSVSNEYHINSMPYPNTNIVSIEFENTQSNDYAVQLLDQMGRIVFQAQSNESENNIEFNTSRLVQGNYLLEIYNTRTKNKYVNKIIIN